jgi:dTDP-4-dehydrorhamnose reductase
MVHVSTDLAFDGERGWYEEQDPPSPLSVYGRSKAEAETAVLAHPGCVVVRVSLLFGCTLSGRNSFFDQQVKSLRAGRSVTCFEDEWRTPLGLSTAAEALLALARSKIDGLLHVGGPERLSRLEMGQRLARYLGVNPALVVAGRRMDAAAAEARPRDVSLRCGKWRGLFPGQRWATLEEELATVGMAVH